MNVNTAEQQLVNDKQRVFEELVKPVIRYLNDFHPHVSVIITPTSAELAEGVRSYQTFEYVRD